MSADPHALKADATLVESLSALFRELPGSVWAAGAVDPGVWDRALLDPARDILSRSGKGFRARLLDHAWRLAGGGAAGPPPSLGVAIEVLHVGSLVIDDIEDDSRTRRGGPALHRAYGLPVALNTGNWLYFVALTLVARCGLTPALRLALHEDIALALLRCHQGQALDLSTVITAQRRGDVRGLVDGATRLKTGSLMKLAALLGARSAGGAPPVVDGIARFGCELGVGLQMLDDWSGISVAERREKGREDVRLARPTWPWAWLAGGDDELHFAQLAREARAAVTDWELDRVLDDMRAALVTVAPERIRAQLDASLERLLTGDLPSDVLESVSSEIDALERAYG